MIRLLKIQNLILIESAEIPFGERFNVLSGETGSGKSAIMEGLKIAFGQRSDSALIRKGSDKAIVEAAIEVRSGSPVHRLLADAGIDHTDGEELLIRREISATGKSRAFVNHQLVQISFLKQLGDFLVSIVSQHANQQLLTIDHHRLILDTFANLNESVEVFGGHFKRELETARKIKELKASESARLRELEVCRIEIEEIEEARLREGEDEELYREFALLTSTEDRLKAAQEVYQALNGIAPLKRLKASFEFLTRQDPKTASTAQSFTQALLELEEVANEMRRYLTSLEANPERLNQLNERLALLTKLQKKYGSSFAEIQQYLAKQKMRAAFLENADNAIEELQRELAELQQKNWVEIASISKKRHQFAAKLGKAVTSELHLLNMPNAEFLVAITAQEVTNSGQDRVEFLLKPNVGENCIPIRDSASGGELSRVLLALKTLLAGKEAKSALVFDEVDANIGGSTASIVGDKLKALGLNHQVICITHFPQVARHADTHWQISKSEKAGRTVTQVVALDKKSREQEILRMLGE